MRSFKMLITAVLIIFPIAVFSQDTTRQKMKAANQQPEKIKYKCPMHPGETGAKPGKCSQCGMDLVKFRKEEMNGEGVKAYFCPMKCEGDKTYEQPGKCAVCGMALKEKENQGVIYSCPMKCEGGKTYDKPGKCPVCGMNLTGSPKEKMKKVGLKTYTCPMHPDITSNQPGQCSKCKMDLKEKKEDHSGHQH